MIRAARLFKAASVAAVVTTAGFTAISVFGPQQLRIAASDLLLFVAACVAAFAGALAAASQHGRSRRVWILMTLAAASWALGEGIWGFYELLLGVEVPFPSAADVGYLAAIPFAALGLSSVLTFATSRLRTLIDGLMVTATLVLVAWTPVLAPIYRDSSENFSAKAIALAYPLGDILLLSVVIFVIATTTAERSQFLLLGIGVAAFAVADIVYGYLSIKDVYVSGALIDTGWLVGYLLLGLAAIRSWSQTAREEPRYRNFVLIQLLPYLGMALSAIVAILEIVRTGKLSEGIIWIGCAMAILLAIRQVLTVAENLSLTRHLESKVQERTADLQRAMGELEEAQRLQEEFVANTSHELRTPITVIVGTMRTLLRINKEADPVSQDLLVRGNRAADRMSQLVQDLLTVASITDQRAVVVAPFDVTQQLRRIVDDFEPPGKEVILTAAPHLIAAGDEAAFRMIVLHLLSNAQKFGPPASHVVVEAKKEGEAVSVSVADEGPGIPEEDQERVFARFVQLDGGSTREHGGVGLGLFIARRLAIKMGGSLDVVGGPPGTTIRLTLPAHVVPATAESFDVAAEDRIPRP